ncbi:hypothetical protein NBT05_06390 [Aquimarina sp. ERC-38]|uniref:hypothetical protein n=1 Tax=Aquimarina sp. ERC-38 TaxID=2949996 RepID=UPI0022471E1A|nr:hypothetical protein [Aquimarina sp. ERC-38]UZO82097.1 hypothetical protein NBT05_06390 [Aquimarina sp. ERC-38]
MIKEIYEKYGEFSDSWIEKIDISKDTVSLTLICANKMNSFKYEKILLELMLLEKIILNKNSYEDIIGIKDLLLKENENYIVMDLDPIDHFDYLKENPQSNFKIWCKDINYKFIEEYNTK